ncbi:MAG: 50S ribosomal protein L1 [Gemmataceae bacterium]|nr:50S ribosomal protein L1 [Gemmataceae bacterium]
MAKKQAAEAAEPKPAEPRPAEAGDAKDRPKEPKEPKAPKGEGRGEAKGEGKKAKAKGSPEAPAADKKAAAPAGESPAAPAPSGGAAAPSAGAPAAADGKKKKRAGIPPARGKKLRNQLKNQLQKVAKEGPIPLPRAVHVLKSLRRAKFDETVEIHMWLGVDVSQSDQLIRGTVPLPHGVGKTVRVVVFCQGDNVKKAQDAGAEFAGADDLIEKIQKQNWLDFDVALATQDMMGKVSRLGKVLGPRGLMPTPKAGTVITGDVATAVRDFKAGKVEFRTDKGGNVHAGVGKISFDEHKLTDNINAFVDAIRHAKPSGVKGHYIKSMTICSTMSPGVPVAVV